MDDDTKTLLAILALVYGSSNGIGLFKDALDKVKERTEDLKNVDLAAVDATNVRNLEKKVFRSLWAPRVIAYIILVLTPAAFLGFVLWHGPNEALVLLGLAQPTPSPSPYRPSPFYWILLVLILLASLQLLSPWLAAWGRLISPYLAAGRRLIRSWTKRT